MKKGLIEAGVEIVRPAYLGVLLCLWQEDERKVIDLGRCARLEPSTMTGLLDRMERDGLVYRAPDPNDRRAHRICLTAEGKQVKDPVMAVTPKVVSSFFKGISDDDLNHTINILQRVLINIGEESGQ
jgi:DNA-binding MarR family transcriptional regulator